MLINFAVYVEERSSFIDFLQNITIGLQQYLLLINPNPKRGMICQIVLPKWFV